MSLDPYSDVQDAVGGALRARDHHWRNSEQRAQAMQAVASSLRGAQHDILRTASDETHLTVDELRPELERMIGTIRIFSEMVSRREWVRAAIDTPSKDPAGAIGPNHDVRSMLIPLGDVVAVFGASNFPLAYGVCGGDTASAWAAGCTVVVKEHPGHPKTGRLLHHVAREGLRKGGVNPEVLGYVYDDESAGFEVARLLVEQEDVCAVGFTGSVQGGLAIERLAHARKRPIPVFAEMSSTNPVFITAGALAERGEEIARELGASMLARYGQQCTSPGLMILESENNGFQRTLEDAVRAAQPRQMLTPRVRQHFLDRTREVPGSYDDMGEVSVIAQGRSGKSEAEAIPTLFEVVFMELGSSSEVLTREMFGPAAMISVIGPECASRVEAVLAAMGGQLTASIYTARNSQEPPQVRALMERLSRSVGRIIFNGPPTGVRVATAMVHGGPFPATNRPEMTAVGPLAIERWCRRICFQNAPSAFLPQELLDDNPLKISRIEDGVLVSSRSATAPVT